MEDKIIKVAQVIGKAVNGGTESLWMNYYKHIDRKKVQFDFLVESESAIINKGEIESMGGHVVIIPSYNNIFKYIKTLTEIFKKNKYDIVHSNMNALSIFTLKAAKKAGIKVRIAHSHSTSSKNEISKNIVKKVLKKFSKIYSTDYFACSEYAGRWLFGNKTYNQGKITIIKNAIDIDLFKFDKNYRKIIRNEFNILDDEKLIGNIGRMMPQKNQTFLIKVFAKYHKINKKSKLMIVNDGPLLNELKELANKLNVFDSIVFVGPKTDIYKYFSAFDLFVLPSIYEGLGIVLVEAQANGLNCISSTSVPQEVNGTGNVNFVELNEDKWLDIFLKEELYIRNDLNICKNKLLEAQYGIVEAAKTLVNIYEKILMK